MAIERFGSRPVRATHHPRGAMVTASCLRPRLTRKVLLQKTGQSFKCLKKIQIADLISSGAALGQVKMAG